jgi:uncharacterized protein YgbK (DUF1537 family)
VTQAADLPVVVLDDDPTGTQAVADVPVLLEWDADLLRRVASGASAVHLLTNSRAYPPREAYSIVRGAAETAAAAVSGARFVLRGDSTLRAHLLEEYWAVTDGVYPGTSPPLLLVPALPAAGRVTVGGVHLIERNGTRMPLHETEYAEDPAFAYSSAALLHWADERSGGFFPAGAGREIHLDRLRGDGPEALAKALADLAASEEPAVCVPDAETVADLELIASGLERAEARGATVIVRCAPTFAGVLAGNLARRPAPAPSRGRGLLVVCGSYVATTTRQLAVLLDAHPGTLVEADPILLASGSPDGEIARAAADVRGTLARLGLAVLATPRTRAAEVSDLLSGRRIARNLARVAGAVAGGADVVLAKGGITSHVTAHTGLGARSGRVLGPLVDGVALWQLDVAGRSLPYVVFPGNVGDDETLRRVVELILGKA